MNVALGFNILEFPEEYGGILGIMMSKCLVMTWTFLSFLIGGIWRHSLQYCKLSSRIAEFPLAKELFDTLLSLRPLGIPVEFHSQCTDQSC